MFWRFFGSFLRFAVVAKLRVGFEGFLRKSFWAVFRWFLESGFLKSRGEFLK